MFHQFINSYAYLHQITYIASSTDKWSKSFPSTKECLFGKKNLIAFSNFIVTPLLGFTII